jgi:DNA replication protein DnaC
MMKLICEGCGMEFETGNREAYCAACQLAHAKQRAAGIESKRLADWKKLCPAVFKITDPAKLPNQAAYRQAMAWTYGPEGLLLHGPTGTGKTKTAWQILRREFFAGHYPAILNSSAALQYAGLFAVNSKDAELWVKRLCKKPILLLDDTFKVKLTEAFEAALFSIVDRRSENLLPIIAATNDTGTSLGERMSADRAEPFIRRLREMCRAIAF